MAIFTVLRLVVSSVLFPYIKRSKVVDCVQSQLTNLCRMKEPRTDSPWNRQILKARSVSYLFPYSWVLRCVYCGKCFLKFLVLGNLTCAQEPRWPRVAWWTRTGYSILHDKLKYGSSCPQIVYRLRLSGVWNYPVGWAYLECSRVESCQKDSLNNERKDLKKSGEH